MSKRPPPPLGSRFSAMLFLSASIKSITGARCGLRRFGNFLALELGSDHGADIVAVLVAVFFGLKGRSEAFNELLGEFLFLIFHFDLVGGHRFGGANFVGIEHGVQGQCSWRPDE